MSLIEPISQSELKNEQITTEENINEQQSDEVTLAAKIIVDVKGAVNYPGVFELTEADRVIDAIELAGGYTADADPTLINHAQKLVDEMVIYIPKIGEEVPEMSIIQSASSAGSSISSANTDSTKVNLNTATQAELSTLPGIGPAKAQAIISYREENGRFQTIDDLKKVSGIGDKTYEKLKDLIET